MSVSDHAKPCFVNINLGTTQIDRVMLQEDVTQGERVRAFLLYADGKVNDDQFILARFMFFSLIPIFVNKEILLPNVSKLLLIYIQVYYQPP